MAPSLIIRQTTKGLALSLRTVSAGRQTKDVPIGRAEPRWKVVTERPATVSESDWAEIVHRVAERPIAAATTPTAATDRSEKEPMEDGNALASQLGGVLHRLARKALAGYIAPREMRDLRDMCLRSAALFNGQLPTSWQSRPSDAKIDGELVVLDVSTRDLAEDGKLDFSAAG